MASPSSPSFPVFPDLPISLQKKPPPPPPILPPFSSSLSSIITNENHLRSEQLNNLGFLPEDQKEDANHCWLKIRENCEKILNVKHNNISMEALDHVGICSRSILQQYFQLLSIYDAGSFTFPVKSEFLNPRSTPHVSNLSHDIILSPSSSPSPSSSSSPSTTFSSLSSSSVNPRKRNQRGLEIIFDRVCRSCGTRQSPEWRRGPEGPKTLCNACGLKLYKRIKRDYEKEKTGTRTLSSQSTSSSHHQHQQTSGGTPPTIFQSNGGPGPFPLSRSTNERQICPGEYYHVPLFLRSHLPFPDMKRNLD